MWDWSILQVKFCMWLKHYAEFIAIYLLFPGQMWRHLCNKSSVTLGLYSSSGLLRPSTFQFQSIAYITLIGRFTFLKRKKKKICVVAMELLGGCVLAQFRRCPLMLKLQGCISEQGWAMSVMESWLPIYSNIA